MKQPLIGKDDGKPVVAFGVPLAADGSPMRETVQIKKGDYGADPIGDGLHRMVPSGDIVDLQERRRRLDT